MVINTDVQQAALVSTRSRTLAGRESEWDSLHAAYAFDNHQIIYVWGAPGTGKTHLIQNFSDYLHESSHRVLWSSARHIGSSSQEWERHLSRFVKSHDELSGELLAQAMIADCKQQPFCWIIDAFDDLSTYRESVMQLALELRRHGAYIILTGRTSPFRLWSAQSYIRHHIHIIELTDWEPSLSREVLTERGVTDTAVLDIAIRMAQGRPQLLAAMADGLSILQGSIIPSESLSFMTNAVDLSEYLIEQICHPGSRRMSWRAGQSTDSIDTLVAAAALVPVFNREWMTRVVGRQICNHYWDEFVSSPFLNSYRGGYYGLFPYLRRYIALSVQKIRPWTWEHWTRKIVTYYLGRLQTGSIAWEKAWQLLSGYIRPRLGYILFETNLSSYSSIFRDDAAIRGMHHRFQLTDSEGRIVAESTLITEESDTLHITGSVWDLNEPRVVAKMVSTLAETFYQYRKVVWESPPASSELTTILECLHFTEDQNQNWTLHFHAESFSEWITKLVSPPVALPPVDRVSTVQKVLQAIRDGHEDFGDPVRQFWNRLAIWDSFRPWFLDALHSVSLGEHMDGKTILVLYYLDRRGTHEELAEILHVSRATYFRNHRSALEKLADAIFN